MFKSVLMGAAAVLAFGLPGTAQAEDAALCATPDQAIEIQAVYKMSAGLVPGMAARQLDIPEVVIASAMPAVEKAEVIHPERFDPLVLEGLRLK